MAKRESTPYSVTDVANADALRKLTSAKKRSTTPITEDDVAQTLTAHVGDLVAKRRWFCTDRSMNGCKGTAPFLGWSQLLDRPSCPNCGRAMFWHQWAVRIQ